MAAPEWLRTFVAIYRAGTVTDGAADRGLSQPAASQQLAGLERALGAPLFVRSPGGVAPTRQGRALYAEVAGPLDLLEGVLAGLDAGRVPPAPPNVRFGSSAEFFSAEVVPRLDPAGPAVSATFATDEELLDLLVHGEVDVAVTSTGPGRRAVDSTPLGLKRFVLVAAPAVAPATPPSTLVALGTWLVGRPWVAYSAELPLTRRFWQHALGRPFAGDLRLTAPDLRAVAAAVALGQGVSLLPTYVCGEALARGRMVELFPVAGELASEPWFVCTRAGDVGRPHVAAFARALRVA